MYVRGDQWPLFLYKDNKFDVENPWEGLLRSQLLVLVRCDSMLSYSLREEPEIIQAYKHVFTSPSSADHDDAKATRSGNAHMHGMTSVTTGSLAYIATQVSGTLIDKEFLTDFLS